MHAEIKKNMKRKEKFLKKNTEIATSIWTETCVISGKTGGVHLVCHNSSTIWHKTTVTTS